MSDEPNRLSPETLRGMLDAIEDEMSGRRAPEPPREASDEDTAFLFGGTKAELDAGDGAGQNRAYAVLWNRVLADAGMGEVLARMGVDLASFPEDTTAAAFRPDGRDVDIDLTVLLAEQFREAKAADERFEKATDRWRKTPGRVQGYVPGDAGSFRWSLLYRELFRPFWWSYASPEDANDRIMKAIGGAAAYMAVPHFIPADLALDVVTSTPPAREYRGELRLPARYVLVFHDGVPTPVVMGDDDTVDRFGENYIVSGETLVLGGILAAEEDGRISADGLGFIILGRRDSSGEYGWRAFPVPYGDHPAGRVLLNYAALLSWENWSAPPKVPSSPHGKEGTSNQIKRAARTPEAQAGGWHGVRVLDYRPPEPAPERPRGESGGRSLRYRSERRGHYKYRVRIGIRDEQDRLVGPVYGANAVEGVTFERVKKWFRRTNVREDLPERPGSTVYQVTEGVTREAEER